MCDSQSCCTQATYWSRLTLSTRNYFNHPSENLRTNKDRMVDSGYPCWNPLEAKKNSVWGTIDQNCKRSGGRYLLWSFGHQSWEQPIFKVFDTLSCIKFFKISTVIMCKVCRNIGPCMIVFMGYIHGFTWIARPAPKGEQSKTRYSGLRFHVWLLVFLGIDRETAEWARESAVDLILVVLVMTYQMWGCFTSQRS